MSTATRRAPVVSLAALATFVLAGCSATGEGPSDPKPSGRAAADCRALHERLPERVTGQDRNALDPESKYTAAWGDPAVELRCGVPRPEVLTPGSEHYNPTTEAAEVNGVSWLIEEREDGYRFTTTDRRANVELTVPGAYAPETGALVDLAKAVRDSVPDKN
ncbi:DUF3515 domain-containing protein [Streptomyces sp. HNM0574]|uniref:DUF3515 domain-containing protein n=1 Tax=Streptomyces sp. HNM0574 TaxID=2714954 RepID=UPI0032179AF6